MVASANTDIYSPFQQTMISEEGPQSSEEGSGLHSPVFGAPYPTHNDNCMFCLIIVFNPCLPSFVNKVRYQHSQLDVHHSTPMMMPQYDYGHNLNTQQPPMLHAIQQPPSSNSRHITFSHYNIPTRNHIGAEFSPQTPRIPSVSHAAPIDFRYPPERRLSSAPSHDHSYTRSTGISMDNDHGHHRPPVTDSNSHSETSPASAESGTSPRETRKETSSVVIACRQW
jgi:hypothetical protein